MSISGLTVAGMKQQFSDEHKIAQKAGFDPMPVVKFGEYEYVILHSELVHPGHNTAEVINIAAESTDSFKILVTTTDKKHSVGNAWISYGEEGGVFALAIFTERNTVTDIRVRTAVLSYRLVPPTVEDAIAVQRMFDEEIEGAAMMQQVEISMRLEQQIFAAIPAQLRQLRQNSGWSQTELGRRLGISQQYVAQLEKGDRQPPAELLRKIAGLINDPPSKLEDLITDGMSPRDIQRGLAEYTRKTTGKPARGQLWQECDQPGCDNQPVCLNCLLCQDHCQCDFGGE